MSYDYGVYKVHDTMWENSKFCITLQKGKERVKVKTRPSDL